ncbi:MAG: nickel-dependent hydrogenase large subunit [Candidatus Euphemobacter frigidus]|nr:nickel-dependent hydrogenase large subunit [Candidatus Euphemobacter frigidus]MDP8275644.1 nickel-dependent hydrogenase large subunit [Candidatus Euphemobacter frigidus]
MGTKTIIPFGPQHPVLPEPIHLDLVLEDEKVLEAIPSIGFIHRGLEFLCLKKPFQDMVYIAERICGICSFMHGMSASEVIESIMKIEIPPRASYLRVFWSELSRIHSHLLWLGLAADAFGYEALFAHCWRVRESILDIIEETTGARVIFGTAMIGGVRRDIDRDTLGRIKNRITEIEESYRKIASVFIKDYTTRYRLVGVGVITKEEAYQLGAVGPTARASGIGQDMRQLGYEIYDELDFEPVTESDGDCFARCMVRIREIYGSFDLIRQVIDKIPPGEISVKFKGFPEGEHFIRVEQPRGEVVYYARGDGTKFLDRFRIRTPTFANIPPLVKMLAGCELGDVPVIVLSIDPCISCMER